MNRFWVSESNHFDGLPDVIEPATIMHATLRALQTMSQASSIAGLYDGKTDEFNLSAVFAAKTHTEAATLAHNTFVYAFEFAKRQLGVDDFVLLGPQDVRLLSS